MSDGSDGMEAVVQQGFYVALAVIITVLAVIGFWPSYWGPLLSGTLEMHWLLHLHGLLFTGWVSFFILQAALVYRRRVNLHRRLGAYVGILWGLLVFLVGLSATFGTASPAIGNASETLADFVWGLMFSIPSIVGFGALFAAGLYYRNRPVLHKRLMVFATLMLLSAATVRMCRDLIPLPRPIPEAFGIALPIGLGLLVVAYDRWTRRGVQLVSWIGVTALVAIQSSILFVYTDTWKRMSARIAGAVANVLLPLM